MVRGLGIVKIALCAGLGSLMLSGASDMASALSMPDALRCSQQGLPVSDGYMTFMFVGCILGMAGSVIYLFGALSRVLVIAMVIMAALSCLYIVLCMPPGYTGFVQCLRPAAVGISMLGAVGMAMIVVPVNLGAARNVIRRPA